MWSTRCGKSGPTNAQREYLMGSPLYPSAAYGRGLAGETRLIHGDMEYLVCGKLMSGSFQVIVPLGGKAVVTVCYVGNPGLQYLVVGMCNLWCVVPKGKHRLVSIALE